MGSDQLKTTSKTPRKESVGCMLGLFNLFYIRPRKMLPDKPQRSRSGRLFRNWFLGKRNKLKLLTNAEQSDGSSNNEDQLKRGDVGIKTSKVHCDQILSTDGQEIPGDHHHVNNIAKTSASSGSFENSLAELDKVFCGNVNLVALLEDLYEKKQKDRRIDGDDIILEKALNELLDDLIVKLSNANTCNVSTKQHEELMKASEILRSNRNIFLKVLQDPNSRLVKHFQNRRNSNSNSNSDAISGPEPHEADKSKQIDQKRSQSSSSDVTDLNSTPRSSFSSNTESEREHFSLFVQEGKRRLKQAFGISMKGQKLRLNLADNAQKAPSLSPTSPRLHEQVLKDLVNSNNDYCLSPRGVFVKDNEHCLSPRSIRSPKKGAASEQSSPFATNSANDTQTSYLDAKLLNSHMQGRPAGTPDLEKGRQQPDLTSQSGSMKGSADVAERCRDNGSSPCSTLDFGDVKRLSDNSLAPALSGPSSTQNEETSDGIEKPERPRPVLPHDELTIPRRRLYFEEYEEDSEYLSTPLGHETLLQTCLDDDVFKFGYMKALLEASDFSCLDSRKTSQPLDQLLDLRLYDEIETPSGEAPDDLKLLFDCIAEVLQTIYEKSSSCSPCAVFIRPELQPFPQGEHLIRKVWRGLKISFPTRTLSTLDVITQRDMEIGTWMDIRGEVEDVGVEFEDEIFDEMLEEAILELLDDNLSSIRFS